MESYAKYIEGELAHQPKNTLLEARTLYQQSFGMIPEVTYYKTLERMCKKGTLVHLTKGLYYRPEISRFGLVPIGEEDIIEYYAGNGRGNVVGYRLYNKKGLTTQIGTRVEVLSDALSGQKKTIQNIYVTNIGFSLTADAVPVIETLEILQNYKKIEDLNKTALGAYMQAYALSYSDKAAVCVLESRKYKKSTIAFLARFLEFHRVKHSLGNYLSALSVYDVPDMEEFYESA